MRLLALRMRQTKMEDDLDKSAATAKKFEQRLQSALQLQEATSRFEHAALQPLYLLNGGALIASVTYLAQQNQFAGPFVPLALACWAVGFVLAAIATGCAYKSQLGFYRAGNRRVDYEISRIKCKEHNQPCDCQVLATESFCSFKKHTSIGQNFRTAAEWIFCLSILSFMAGVVCALIAVWPDQ